MKKYAYLSRLEELLAELPREQRMEILYQYEQYFEAAGPAWEDAVAASLGTPEEAAALILHGAEEPAALPNAERHRAALIALGLAALLVLALLVNLLAAIA